MRALQGHSGRNRVDPTLQDNVEIIYGWIDHICHFCSAFGCKSIIVGGLIAGGEVEVKVGEHASSQQWTPRKNQEKIHHMMYEKHLNHEWYPIELFVSSVCSLLMWLLL